MKKWLLALMICLSFSALTAGLFLVPEYVHFVQQKSDEQEDYEEVPIHGASHVYARIYKWVEDRYGNITKTSGGGTIKVEHTKGSGATVNGTTYTSSLSDVLNGYKTGGGDGKWDTTRGLKVTATAATGFGIGDMTWGSNKVTDYNYGWSSHTLTDSYGVGIWEDKTVDVQVTFRRKYWSLSVDPNGGSVYVGTSYEEFDQSTAYITDERQITSKSTFSTRYDLPIYYRNPSRTGYTFSYWSGSGFSTSNYFRGIIYAFNPSSFGDKTATAVWTANRYAVTLNPNGATGGMTSNTTIYALYNSSTLYSSSSGSTTASWTNPTKTGYTFGGWTTGQNSGSVVINTSKALVANISGYTNSSRYWTKAGSATLYAKWTINSYTLTANANGGTIPSTSGWSVASGGASATKSVTYGSTYDTLPTPTRANYSFNGWYTASSGGTRVYTSTTMGAGNQNIYAQWTFSVAVHFIMEGPGEIVDNGCIYDWDPIDDEELIVYFDYDDDIYIGWDGGDRAYIDIHGGQGGSFEIITNYYFTGDVEIDYDGPVQDDNLNNGISFLCSDSAYSDIYVYFYTYKYVNINKNSSYGTVSHSQVRVSGSTTYSISSSGSTVTINGTSVTATPAASTTGFTYAFGSWTIPSDYASQSFPTITANFTRTVNTRSVTLAVRTISEAGAVGNSNAIPSGANLSVSYTNSTPSSTSSSQTSASTAYTIQAGTNMTITPTVPTGYKYLGYNTRASKPSASSFPTSSTITPSNGSTYYFFFQKIAAPLYYTTERGGYWYYEDGEYPQTYIGPTLTGATENPNAAKFNINGTNYTIYELGGSKYIQVASPMTGTIKFNGTTVSLTKGTKYWFRIDPIRWRVSNYGASANKYSFSSVTANLVGVSDILGHGRVNTTTSTFTKRDLKSEEMSAHTQSCPAVGYTNASTNMTYTFDKLIGDGSSSKTATYTKSLAQANTLTVASLSDIQKAAHNGTSQDNLKTYASDLSAMLQCRDYNNSTGWTSSIYNIGSGIAVGPGNSYIGKYWGQLNDGTYNTYGFVYAHQASYATCLGATYVVKEYLQSTGTQWIDSLASIKANTHVETDLMFTGAWSYNMVFGAWNVLSVSLRGTNTVCVASGGSDSQNIGSTTTTNVKYTLKVGAEYAYTQNGTKTAIGGSSNTASDRHILMFAASDSSTGNQPYSWSGLGQCRIYNFKIYEGTTLIRDFVPVVRAYDGQACFWDNVTRGFYLNSGSGIFTTGENVLARGFTAKNYLQSSGTQYIDTGANLNMNTDSYEVKAQATSTTQNGMILGDWKVSNNYYWLYHYQGGSTIRMYLTNSSNSQTNFNTGLTNTNTNANVFKYDGKKMYTNGSLTQDLSSTTFSVATSTCYMFGCHYSDDKVGSWPYQGKIYYLKMWKEGRLIRDLVPAQRDFDRELGFYDLVTGLFFTNIGTGSFTAG